MSVTLHRASFHDEDQEPDELGPFEWVQITYNSVVRVPEDREIARFVGGLWHFEDGTDWTDLTVTAA